MHRDRSKHAEMRKKGIAQKVLELPSTALLAPCAAESAELLALIALWLATFVAAAVAPFWLKQYCPALPDFNWPFSNGHVLQPRNLRTRMNSTVSLNFPLASPIASSFVTVHEADAISRFAPKQGHAFLSQHTGYLTVW